MEKTFFFLVFCLERHSGSVVGQNANLVLSKLFSREKDLAKSRL